MDRVQKIIAESGFCSRRKAEELIEKGVVTVNGKKISLGDKASDTDVIKIRNKELSKEQKVYIMLHKPKGYITTSSDMYERRKVTDLVEAIPERLYPVGRLDRDASGLLLLTNDGDWANKVMHPRYAKEKEYEVELDRFIDKRTIAQMNQGFRLKDGWVKPFVKAKSKNYCSCVIHEGRNKIIKRIFNEFGFRVKVLKRVRIGQCKMGSLKPGAFKFISSDAVGPLTVKPVPKEVPKFREKTTEFRNRPSDSKFQARNFGSSYDSGDKPRRRRDSEDSKPRGRSRSFSRDSDDRPKRFNGRDDSRGSGFRSRNFKSNREDRPKRFDRRDDSDSRGFKGRSDDKPRSLGRRDSEDSKPRGRSRSFSRDSDDRQKRFSSDRNNTRSFRGRSDNKPRGFGRKDSDSRGKRSFSRDSDDRSRDFSRDKSKGFRDRSDSKPRRSNSKDNHNNFKSKPKSTYRESRFGR